MIQSPPKRAGSAGLFRHSDLFEGVYEQIDPPWLRAMMSLLDAAKGGFGNGGLVFGNRPLCLFAARPNLRLAAIRT
jgi:hypothetical protein